MVPQGLAWLLRADAERLATPKQPLRYVLNLKLGNPADTTAFGIESVGPNRRHGNSPAARGLCQMRQPTNLRTLNRGSRFATPTTTLSRPSPRWGAGTPERSALGRRYVELTEEIDALRGTIEKLRAYADPDREYL